MTAGHGKHGFDLAVIGAGPGGHVATEAHGTTNVAGLYAIGDVASAPWLAHKASHEAVRCVEHIAGKGDGHAAAPIPSCTYTPHPTISESMHEAVLDAFGAALNI